MRYDVHSEISDEDSAKTLKKRKSKKIKQVEKVSDLSESELLQKLVKYTTYWYQDWSEFIQSAREHMKFLYVDQWDSEVRSDRESNDIPTMQFNHVRSMIDGIIGQQRKNSPTITINSIKGNEDKSAIDWRTDLIREIWYKSKADDATDTCYKNQLICGWGFLRVSIHYENSNTFAQILRIESDPDYQVAFFDPNATDLNKANGDFCGMYQRISKDDFKRDYPDIPNPTSVGQESFFTWNTEDTITVCDIYYKDYFKKTIVKLSDGQELELKEAKKLISAQEELRETALNLIEQQASELVSEAFENALPPLLEIIQSRDVLDYKIKHCRFIQDQIIDKTDWPGKLLPIVYVPANKAVIDGRENPISFINDLQDPQRLHNYVISDMARGLLNTTKTRWIGTENMVKGYEQVWRQPQKVQGMMPYNPDNRVPGGKPDLIDPAPFNATLVNLQGLTSQEMQTISGRYEESKGQESNAISGIAIKERISASNNVVNVIHDNLLKGIEQVGKIIMDLLPQVYGDEREVTVREESGEAKKITINKQSGRFIMPQGGGDMFAAMDKMEQEIENRVDEENYDIIVKAAGSFDYQKQQSLDFWIKMMQAFPPSAPLLADLIAAESDVEGSAIAESRLKTLLPPDILAKEQGQPPPPPTPNPMVEIENQRTQMYQKDLEMKGQKLQQEKEKNDRESMIDMAELKLKEREQRYKEEKARIEAEIDQMRAIAELNKVAIAQAKL